ncbi:SPOR domain-containing protein [Sphingomonas sp. 2R-10]|uniref:SPOR domain-containing protein n=1 Tax=Sphingomonas sp. 2R-10 TaxID=3045148 RepID=UPI000F7A5E1F|nr:SPOR domain-containing protein [Sphingomonas sp. 2R-10]MDJ0278848.1 SPOR domain-containing protein [Sphingomonas sp. 2R-10]
MTALALLMLAGGGQAGSAPPPVIHEQRLDEVGPVLVAGGPGAQQVLQHRTLPTGSFAEVTDLDSGKTIVVEVQPYAAATGREFGALSSAAGRALCSTTTAMVRIRPAAPSPAEQVAIRTGSTVARLDTPPFLLAVLRRRLPQSTPVEVPPPAPMPTPPARPTTIVTPTPAPRPAPPKQAAPARAGRWFVQVATLSDAARAATLAKSVDGVVRSAGRLYRVQAGPFATRAAAETARAAIARRGFGDARTIAQD